MLPLVRVEDQLRFHPGLQTFEVAALLAVESSVHRQGALTPADAKPSFRLFRLGCSPEEGSAAEAADAAVVLDELLVRLGPLAADEADGHSIGNVPRGDDCRSLNRDRGRRNSFSPNNRYHLRPLSRFRLRPRLLGPTDGGGGGRRNLGGVEL